MNRNLMHSLIQWKNSPQRKPLILNGARQTGKTWILKEFGKTEFKSTAYFNCDQNPMLKEIFREGYDIQKIIRNLSVINGEPIEKKETLIVLDEIQEIPEALTALKYFCEDAPEYHVAAAGSLLGLSLHSGTGFPVGKVDIQKLYPMDFLEFVQAARGHELAEIIERSPLEELNALHTELTGLLREYYFTGGMPEAVNAYINKKSPDEIRTIQDAILYAYEKGISKHAPPKDIQRIHMVWKSIPMQLAKENKKFIYGAVKEGSRAKDFETALQWLIDAGLVAKVSRVNKAAVPLKFYEDFNAFKLFMLDSGLMGALSETPAEQIIIGKNIFEEYKGAFTEQFVFQQLQSRKNTSPMGIYYYSAADSKQELDFLLQNGSSLIPVEVKAEENLRAKSLHQFVTERPGVHGVRLSMSPYRKQDWMTNIPLYASCRAWEIL